MEPATERPQDGPLSGFLAGLQAGMLGIGWMLLWLGVSAVYQNRSFWTAGNLMASVFYGGDSIRAGFSAMTVSGIALYLLVYSSLGAVFALVLRDRVSRGRLLLLAVLFAVLWYYLVFRLVARTAFPLVFLLHAERPMLFGHVIYGTFLGYYSATLMRPPAPGLPTHAGEEEPPPAAAAEPAPGDAGHSPM